MMATHIEDICRGET
jgi:hypothetical protein